MGLSLFIGLGLEEFVFERPLMRLYMRMLGSADDPSCFTFVSPNMLCVTGLLIRFRILGKLCDEEVAEEAATSKLAVLAAGVAETTAVRAANVDIGTCGWGKLCIVPHSLLIRGKLLEVLAAVFVWEGGGFAETAAAASFTTRAELCCCSVTVLTAARDAFVVAGTRSLLSPPLTATEFDVVVGFSASKGSPLFLSNKDSSRAASFEVEDEAAESAIAAVVIAVEFAEAGTFKADIVVALSFETLLRL